MTKLSILSAAVLLIGSHNFAAGQDASGQSSGKAPSPQCWDKMTNQLRQRSATDANKGTASGAGETAGSSESGSSEGMAGIIPGSKGSASVRAAEEAAASGTGASSSRPPGMPDC